MRVTTDLALVLLAFTPLSCGAGDESVAVQSEPAVFTTFPPAAWMARAIAGEALDVVPVLPPGRTAETFRPTREDLVVMQSAPMIVLHGAEFETWALTATLPRSRVLELAEGLEEEFITVETVTHSHGAGPAHAHAGVNPFLWLDPELARREFGVLHASMSVRFPALAQEFKQGFARTDARFVELAAKLEALAPRLRKTALFSEHPDWAYPARRLGVEIGDWKIGRDADAAALDAVVAEQGGRSCVLIVGSELDAAVVARYAEHGVAVVVWPKFVRDSDEDYVDVQAAAFERIDRVLPK
ncbi:MAG: zinc ABC transporter substrate-binding protein [Planctomycetes bacterium]|nr:zinc ABC transporter substrate-binding protein [Planctomycetota bacterium]